MHRCDCLSEFRNRQQLFQPKKREMETVRKKAKDLLLSYFWRRRRRRMRRRDPISVCLPNFPPHLPGSGSRVRREKNFFSFLVLGKKVSVFLAFLGYLAVWVRGYLVWVFGFKSRFCVWGLPMHSLRCQKRTPRENRETAVRAPNYFGVCNRF